MDFHELQRISLIILYYVLQFWFTFILSNAIFIYLSFKSKSLLIKLLSLVYS